MKSIKFQQESETFSLRNIKLPPAYWLLPLVMSIPTLYIILAKGFCETTAKLTYLGSSWNVLAMLIRQLCEYGFFASVHFWLYKLLVKRFNFPAIILNLLFYGIYFEIFGFSLYDFEFARINMQLVLPSLFTTYVGRLGGSAKLFVPPLYDIPSAETNTVVAKSIVMDTINDSPKFWIPTILILTIWVVVQLAMVWIFRKNIAASMNFKIGKIYICCQKDIYNGKKICWEPEDEYKNWPFILSHVLAALHVLLLFSTLVIPSDYKMTYYSKLPYIDSALLSFTHFEKSLSRETRKNLLNLTRSYLPPGRRWLDNRKDPVYPAVHAGMEAYCAYNKNDKDCANFKPVHKKPVTELPNVIFLFYESLTPSHYMLTDEFIKEHASVGENDPKRLVTDTPYFNDVYAKNLAKYAKYSIMFSGMSSLGIPTSSGWHGLVTGLPPSQSFGNIVDGGLIHSDDLPSNMLSNGYRSFYTAASLFNFDCSRNWVYRRPAEEEAKIRLHCDDGFGDLINDTTLRALITPEKFPKLRKCTKGEVQKEAEKMRKLKLDFPKWFDYALSYTPPRKIAKILGLEPETIKEESAWPADRIVASEFLTHWVQNKQFLKKNNISKPLAGYCFDIEGHIPYYGYDYDQFYDIKIEPEVRKNQDEYRKTRFLRVNQYADKQYIGRILDWFKENEPNTIFVITGDHGTRDIPIRDSDSKIVDDVVFSSDCVHHSSGIDSFFTVSGMIGYLGNDPKIKEIMNLEKLKGKTFKFATDHNDLVYTFEEIINKINGTEMQPTHRRSRNLIDLASKTYEEVQKGKVNEAYKIINNISWKSFSITSFNSEYREGASVLRSHPADKYGSHYYENASYPQCLRKKSVPPMKLGVKQGLSMYERMFQHIQAETFLIYNNRLYNYGFRNKECIAKGECEFPEPYGLEFNDDFFALCLIFIPVGIMVALTLAAYVLFLLFGQLYFHSLFGFQQTLVSQETDNEEEEEMDLFIN